MAALVDALRGVLELAEEWKYKGEFGWGAWQEGYGPGPEGHILDSVAHELVDVITAMLTR